MKSVHLGAGIYLDRLRGGRVRIMSGARVVTLGPLGWARVLAQLGPLGYCPALYRAHLRLHQAGAPGEKP